MSANTITWLHLSDLHACPNRTGWDANHVLKSLVEDLKELQKENHLRPDLIFFTGDAAFGQLGDQRGDSLQDQYKYVQQFLDGVRRAFRPELSVRDVYLVPGNHDVNRDDIDETQTSWLRDSKRSLIDIISMMQARKRLWIRFMERLEDYKLFLKTNGYDHLLTDDKNRLIYADERDIAGLRVGIAGLNSAWSCYGGEDDKARLWCGGKYQVEELLPNLSKADFSIALIHHPGNWFVAKEDPNVQRLLESCFQFVLHGHEHQDWVRTDSKTGHTVIWAGPCYERFDKQNGYNMVQLDRRTGEGKVWLREYKETGRGWVAHNIKTLAPRGVWTLEGLKWFQPLERESKGSKQPQLVPISKKGTSEKLSDAIDTISVFERRFCEALVRKYDYLELFGADIPRESQRHSLSVAYVSLNLTGDEDEEDTIQPTPKIKKVQTTEKKLPFIGARPVSEVFDHLSVSSGRLLIRGVAGGGKSTLLRWAAIQSGKANLEDLDLLTDEPDSRMQVRPEDELEDASIQPAEGRSIKANWRTKIPFLIRLRDCTSGSLPRPKDWPALIAKELPDPPSEWIDSVLTSGRALVLLDGVDEVPSQRRNSLATEIENLVSAYPENYWIVSTRPGAVDQGWLSKLDFLEARIESMSLADQHEFVDKWYSAVAAELRSTARRAENLEKLASSLKEELGETPSIARLAIYPLLCAMICALYRERNQKLPETQAALCEDLCKMLLHRRELETPGMSLVHLPPDYRKLDYEHKKYIVAEMAKHMVESGVSSVEEAGADSLITEALKQFPDHAQAKPQEMRRAFVERSGLLRPSGTNRVDFIHNTLKEYLAAGRFVADDDYKALAKRADDDTWQPVILFSAALPTPGFASNLISELLKRISRSFVHQKKKSKQLAASRRKATEKQRAREFFVVRCRNAAFRLEPRLAKRVRELASGLFPPNTIADAEVLASLGDMVIPHLNPKQRATTRQKVACIRALRLIGGGKVKSVLKSFVPGRSKSILTELITAAAELNISLRFPVESLDLSTTSISSLSPLSALSSVRSLNLAGTSVEDLGPLSRLRNLESLNLDDTSIQNLSPLTPLRKLKFLQLRQSRADLRSFGKLKALQGLSLSGRYYYRSPYYARGLSYRSLEGLSYIDYALSAPNLSSLLAGRFQRSRRVRDRTHRLHHAKRVSRFLLEFPPASSSDIQPWIPVLEYLDHIIGIQRIRNAVVSLLPGAPRVLENVLYYQPSGLYSRSRSLFREADLDFSDQAAMQESVLAPLLALKNLRILDLSGNPIIELLPLAHLRKLEALILSGIMAVDITALVALPQLKWLELGGSLASDFSQLSRLTNLRVLDLSGAQINDTSFLTNLRHLELLNLANAEFSDPPPLHALPSLRYLFLTPPTGERLTPVKARAYVRSLQDQNRRVQIFLV